MKTRTRTDFIIVHNAATSPSMDIGVKDIDRWHRQRGFAMVGYHFVIRRDGTVEEGRDVNVPGAHVQGHNSNSIGICLAGGIAEEKANTAQGFRALPNRPQNNFTPAQFASLSRLLKTLKTRYPLAKIRGHSDFASHKPHCPGFPLAAWLREQGIPAD